MPMEDRYKDLFNDPNLENEDWLEPRSELFSSIKAELYPQKKDRKQLIIFLLLGIITILTIALLFSMKENNSIGELNKPHIESSLTSENTGKISPTKSQDATEVDEMKIDKSTSQNYSQNNKGVTKNNLDNNSNLSFEVTAPQTIKSVVKENYDQLSNETPVLSSSKERLDFNTVVVNQNSVIENNLFDNLTDKSESSTLILDFIPFLNRIESKDFPYSSIKKEINSFSSRSEDLINVKSKRNKAWGINLSAGYFTTKFILNSNYLAALNPADYKQGNGNGQYVDLRIYKELNKRLSISIGSNFGRTVFNSGHNSVVTYPLIDEDINQSISFDMPMATPIGFISSQITIDRAADNVENETDLIIDLKNKHTLNMLDLTLGANYKVIDRNSISLSTSSAFGYTYLFDVQNEFTSFTPSNVNFSSGDSQITSGQQNVNSLTPVLDLGLDLHYEIRNGMRVGFSYKFKTNLNPVFELNEFNSTMNRNHYGLNFQLDLN